MACIHPKGEYSVIGVRQLGNTVRPLWKSQVGLGIAWIVVAAALGSLSYFGVIGKAPAWISLLVLFAVFVFSFRATSWWIKSELLQNGEATR